MNTEKIAERIQKLLQLAESDNEYEARLASERANEMLIRYNLSRDDVETAANEYGYVEVRQGRTRVEDKFLHLVLSKCFFVKPIYFTSYEWKVTLDDGSIVTVDSGDVRERMTKYKEQGLAESFRMTSSNRFSYSNPMKKKSITALKFFGERFNCEIAKYMYEFLYYEFKALWKKYKSEMGYSNEAFKQAYYSGLAGGLTDQLQARKAKVEQETGLVVVENAKLQKAFDAESLNTVPSRSRGYRGNDGANASGRLAGQNMTVRAGIRTQATQSGRFLT